MSEPQSRLPDIEGTLVFEATWSGSIDQKAATLGFAALFWTIWLSLWLPAFTWFVWLAAPVYGAAQASNDLTESATTLGLIFLTGVVLGAFLALWGTLQWVFNQGNARAEDHPSVTQAELAEFHGLAVEALQDAWRHRRLVIHHEDSGRVSRIETSVPRRAPFSPTLVCCQPPAVDEATGVEDSPDSACGT